MQGLDQLERTLMRVYMSIEGSKLIQDERKSQESFRDPPLLKYRQLEWA